MQPSRTRLPSVSPCLVIVAAICLALVIPALRPASASAATVVSVKDFGARGNGVSDDTRAIRAAMAARGPKTVLFPSGTYVFANVHVPSNTSVVFADGAKAKPSAGSDRSDYLFTAQGTTTDRLHDIAFTGGVLDGRNIHSALFIKYVDDVTISGVRESGALYATALYGCDDVVITGCTAADGENGFEFTSTTHATVTGCTATNMRYDGILFYKRSRYVVATNNTVDGYGLAGVTGRGGIQVYGSSDATITGNTVRNGHADAPGIRFRDSNVFWCADNLVVSPGKYGMSVVRLGDYPGLDGGDGIFARNTIVSAKVRGIDCAYLLSKPVKVVDNVIRDTQNPSSSDPAAGIRLGIPGSLVMGNRIERSGGDGIQVTGPSILVVDNVISDSGRGAYGPKVGVWVEGTQVGVVRNTVSDSYGKTTHGVTVYSGGSAMVRDNVISGTSGSPIVWRGTQLYSLAGDTTLPAMSYATASPGTLYVSATDLQRGVAAMTYSVDGKRAPTRLGRTLSLRLDPSVPHTVRAFAVDRAGNVSRRLNLTTVASLRTVRTTTIDRIPEGWVEGAHN